ncbi:hypothetical protein [Halomonas sp. 3A7M]|uniref:hypothetical protein n=1 Tax=Halomonas sp. 3A7M TaxID=2742616 RepID=UPI0018694DC9|nr:hypothetical protein [Halomonas sp. 3A7M]
MNEWKEHADQLEAALMKNPQALVLHFLKTATPQQVAALTRGHLIETESKAFTSSQSALVARLEQSVKDPQGLSPMAV